MLPQALLDSTTTTLNSLTSKPGLTLISNSSSSSRWYQDKVEGSRRKLAAGYERENFIKQQRRTICILPPHQIICAKQQQQQKRKKKKNPIAAPYHTKTARRTSLLAKWRAEEKVFRKLQRIADRPKSSSKINYTKAVQTPTVQRRRELILRNILGHTSPTMSARPVTPSLSGNSSPDDLQHMNSDRNEASQTTNVVELHKKDSPIADLKGYSPPQIIRKSMFKFVIKLGRSGAGA